MDQTGIQEGFYLQHTKFVSKNIKIDVNILIIIYSYYCPNNTAVILNEEWRFKSSMAYFRFNNKQALIFYVNASLE